MALKGHKHDAMGQVDLMKPLNSEEGDRVCFGSLSTKVGNGKNGECTAMETTTQKPTNTPPWGAVAFLIFIVGLSIFLAVNRIFQVDEVLYSALARFRATGKMDQFIPNVPIILVGPLTWIAGEAKDSVDVLVYMRLPFVGLMWVNALLLVKATGLRLRSRDGLITLLLASTLAPMWDYGFEIRHDVPLLTAILALWCLMRSNRFPLGLQMLLGGILTGCMQLIAFKGFLYAFPMLGLGVYIACPKGKRALPFCIGMILLGIASGLLIGRLIHGMAGTWDLAWGNFRDSALFSANQVERFTPWSTLLRVLSQAPLLACGGLAIILVPVFQPGLGKVRNLVEAHWFPEWAFATICLAILLVNPTPFPYNLIHVVPAFFIALFRFRGFILESISKMAAPGRQLMVGSLIMLHGLPWAVATARHLDMDNDRQSLLIRTAEAMTDSGLHRVFDGSGLVSTRTPIGKHWFIHSFTIRHFVDGSWPSIRSLLAENPTPVILPNYRTSWLPREDHMFLETHYVSLSEDFMVLGTIKGPGASNWEVLAEGRYLVTVFPKGTPIGKGVEIDGRKVEPGFRSFSKGNHQVQVPEGCGVQAVWLGPQLQRVPNLGPAPHPLFVNWY